VVQVGWADRVDVVHRGEIDVVYAREPIDHHGLGTAPLLEEPRSSSCLPPIPGRSAPFG
jgi:hypothetical protein